MLTGGGTGTYNIDSEVDGITDMQVGSYLFMDVNYRNIGGKEGAVYDDFRPSLLVLATAISQPAEGRITIDAGYKAFATDNDSPVLRDIQGVSYRWGGDEHGILQFKNPSRRIEVGDKVLLIASHCDPTVNLYDHFYRTGPKRSPSSGPSPLVDARSRSLQLGVLVCYRTPLWPQNQSLLTGLSINMRQNMLSLDSLEDKLSHDDSTPLDRCFNGLRSLRAVYRAAARSRGRARTMHGPQHNRV